MKNQTSFLYYLILRALIITLCIMLMEVMFFNEVHAGVRVQQSNITYLGSSALPVPTGSCSESPSENDYAPGLAYNPSGNGGAGSFYLSGLKDICLIATNGDGSSSQFCRTDYVTSRYRKPTSKPKRYE